MEEGGETVFPESATKVVGPEWSDCARKGLAVKAIKGDALLFFRCGAACTSCLREIVGLGHFEQKCQD